MFQLDAAIRQNHTLDHVDHRPWPVASTRWLLGQTLEDVLFAHWRVPVDAVRGLVPEELEIETYDGSAWVGVVPMRVFALRGRGLLPVPFVSSFLELNVRTFVSAPGGGWPGIWLTSLDVSSRIAAEAGRSRFGLPYFHSRMSAERRSERVVFECSRRNEPGKVFSGTYRAVGDATHAAPDSLEWFLTERYCLYASDDEGRLRRAEIHHDRWPLQSADAKVELATIAGVPLEGEPVCHVARRQDLLIWSPLPID